MLSIGVLLNILDTWLIKLEHAEFMDVCHNLFIHMEMGTYIV